MDNLGARLWRREMLNVAIATLFSNWLLFEPMDIKALYLFYYSFYVQFVYYAPDVERGLQ